MNTGQTLKGEKPLIIEFLSFKGDILQKRTEILDFYFVYFLGTSIYRETFHFVQKSLVNLFQFLIQQLPFHLKKQSEPKPLEKEIKSNCLTGNLESSDTLHIEICSKKMNELLMQRQICAADIRCLDANSKQCLKKLCLKTCLYRTAQPNPAPQLLDDLNLAGSHLQIEQL
jgi:hypothetical protein